MKAKFLLLLGVLVTTPALADNLLSRAVDFGRELLDETRKLAPGVQNDYSNDGYQQNQAHPDDGRDAPALEPGTATTSSTQAQSSGPAAVVGSAQAAPAAPQSNQGWFVEEDHLK